MTVTNTAAAPLPYPLPESLAGARVVVLGGSRGWGAVAATMLAGLGAAVTVASRSGDLPPDAAAAPAGAGRIDARSTDMRDEAELAALAEAVGQVDHVLVTAATITGGPVASTPFAAVHETVVGWLQGSYGAARAFGPRIRPGGSLTFTSGISTLRPQPGTAAPAAAGGGIEALGRVLAVELAPVRVNTIRPGGIDGALFRRLAGGGAGPASDATVAAIGATLPAGRLAREAEVAATAVFLMANPYVSGQVVGVDGAAALA